MLGFLLKELQRGEDKPKRAARNIRGLLRDTPRYLGQAARLVTRPERVWRGIMADSFKASGVFFDAVAGFLQANGRQRSDSSLLAAANRACQRYHDSVLAKRLAKPGPVAIGPPPRQRPLGRARV